MSDWIDLLDGTSLAGWEFRTRRDGAWIPATEHLWSVVGGVSIAAADRRALDLAPGAGILANGATGRTSDIRTIAEFGSCELHVEFLIPERSNSGVYLQGQYEIQIVDSAAVPDRQLRSGSCGGIYGRWVDEIKHPYDGHPPRVNASGKPGDWQSFDVTFHAPKFDAAGRRVAGARFARMLHNGVLIHQDVVCTGPTRGSWKSHDIALGPLRLQGDHGPVAFRNIRLRPLD